jgi:hypothetical protein
MGFDANDTTRPSIEKPSSDPRLLPLRSQRLSQNLPRPRLPVLLGSACLLPSTAKMPPTGRPRLSDVLHASACRCKGDGESESGVVGVVELHNSYRNRGDRSKKASGFVQKQAHCCWSPSFLREHRQSNFSDTFPQKPTTVTPSPGPSLSPPSTSPSQQHLVKKSSSPPWGMLMMEMELRPVHWAARHLAGARIICGDTCAGAGRSSASQPPRSVAIPRLRLLQPPPSRHLLSGGVRAHLFSLWFAQQSRGLLPSTRAVAPLGAKTLTCSGGRSSSRKRARVVVVRRSHKRASLLYRFVRVHLCDVMLLGNLVESHSSSRDGVESPPQVAGGIHRVLHLHR